MPNNDERVGHLDDPGHDYFDVELGQYLPDVESTLSALDQDAVLRRIWDRDHTAWADEPDEIDNRLGWLTVSDEIVEQVSALTEFAQEVKDAGFRHVVLLGMGGSSLGPEVVRRTIGSADGFPELIVLDSTVPESVDSVTMAIDLSRTLFLVSSKSGGTIEPNSFYRHFRALVEQAVGSEAAGKSFVAITDPDTSLEDLAHSEGFLAVFWKPNDIGGRYSVL
jgi:glucose-6-phosphate isomerase